MGEECREFVILTKSKKYCNYCIAGLDTKTSNLVRLISNDLTIHHAIKPEHITYDDGSEAQLLDVIRICSKKDSSIKWQPENYLLNTNEKVVKNDIVDHKNYKNILSLLSNKKDILFFNQNNKVSSQELLTVRNDELYSLIIVKPEVFLVKIKDTINRTLKANIKYNNSWYNDLSITDTCFNNKYFDSIPLGHHTHIRDTILVISLGELFYGYHYKLIASVFE